MEKINTKMFPKSDQDKGEVIEEEKNEVKPKIVPQLNL